MALNTAARRASAIGMVHPSVRVFPIPDGTLDTADRQHIAWMYIGIAAVAVVTPSESPTITIEQASGQAQITLRHSGTITVTLPCRRRWTLTSTGAIGEASFRIPHDSPAASSEYVNPDAGSLVHIAAEHGSGAWNGVVTRLDTDEHVTTVTASQPATILSRIPVPFNRDFDDAFPHEIVTEVFRAIASASSTYPLAVGTIAAGLPLIAEFILHGETCWSVLLSLMELSGQELQIEIDESGDEPDRLIWGGIPNPCSDGLLLAPGQFRNATYGIDLLEQRSRVTVLSDRDSYTANAPDVATNSNWPAHEVIKIERTSLIRATAEAEVARRLVPVVTLSGAVPPAYWSLREGDYLRVLVPWARFTGATVTARITSREIDESGELMTLELQTASAHQSTNRILDDLRQIQRAGQQGRAYLQGAS